MTAILDKNYADKIVKRNLPTEWKFIIRLSTTEKDGVEHYNDVFTNLEQDMAYLFQWSALGNEYEDFTVQEDDVWVNEIVFDAEKAEWTDPD